MQLEKCFDQLRCVPNQLFNTFEVVQEIDKANSRRLTAMERTQAETNKRLEDLQRMLQSFLGSAPDSNVAGIQKTAVIDVDDEGEKSKCPPDVDGINAGNSSGKGSSEKWWDKLCESSEEEDKDEEEGVQSPIRNSQSHKQVTVPSFLEHPCRYCFCNEC